ncbi:chromate transporter [Cupriavidus basilensis OR16]|uniref:Chromate transporter n=1 Tax=Cupriavidus basilensis OR16 TaxID=1127483 RepID=H1SG49_9BURK|nr:hypothetical protein [Cupriavidus basilensis]EHP38535.1 chromate transporter [Cupriavidus basilensis OR16]
MRRCYGAGCPDFDNVGRDANTASRLAPAPIALAQLAPGPMAAQLAIYLDYVHHRISHRGCHAGRGRAGVITPR